MSNGVTDKYPPVTTPGGSTRLKVAASLFAPIVFRVILAIPIVKHWIVDVGGVDENTLHTILDLLFAGGAAAVGGYFIKKRVDDGNDPSNPLPKIVATQAEVKRVTGDVPKPTSTE